MTAEQLMFGIKEFLEMHPECRDWKLYDTYEGSSNFALAFVPPSLKINDYAEIDKWERQKWFYYANDMMPSEDLQNEWKKIEIEKSIVRYLSHVYCDSYYTKKYYDESSFDGEVAEENVKCEDEIVDFSKLFYGDANILIKLRIATKWGEENFGRFLQGMLLWKVCNDAVSRYIGSLLDECTMSAIKTKIQTNMVEYCNGTSIFNAKYIGIETIKLPIEFGNGIVFAVTFEI